MRETGGNGNQKMFEKSWQEKTVLSEHFPQEENIKDTKSKYTFKWKTIKHDNSGVHSYIRLPGSRVRLK